MRKSEIIRFLSGRESAAPSEIAGAIGLSAPRTRKLLGELAETGDIVAEGVTRARRYRVKADGDAE